MDPENLKEELSETLVPEDVDNRKNTFLFFLGITVVTNVVVLVYKMVLIHQVTIQDLILLYISMLTLCHIHYYFYNNVSTTRGHIILCSSALFNGSLLIYL